VTISDDMLYDRLWQLASVAAPPKDLADLDPDATHRLLAIARVHGVLGLVLHKLRACPPAHRTIWDIAQRAWKGEVVQSMRVRRHARNVLATMRYGGVPAVLVKGPDFADHLFADPQMRPTLDVDVLVPPERWTDAVTLLEATGHTPKRDQPNMLLPTGVVGERSWLYPLAGTQVEVDLHWNLVHLPFFRPQASVDYWNLDWRWGVDGQGELNAASRLVIAAVHAVYHHQFDRLALLTDLQLACRKIAGRSDEQALRAVMERTHTHLALDVALQVAGRFLEDPEIERRRAILFEGLAKKLPAGLFADARRNLRCIRTHFLVPGRRRIREWLLQQPRRPETGWEVPALPAAPMPSRPGPRTGSNFGPAPFPPQIR
jgi:hypothetical protein